MTNEEATRLVDKHAEALREHFDSVVILATRDNPDNPHISSMVVRGRGSWFAQRGMMKFVLDEDLARNIAVELKQANPNE